jgi:hypothetical protein
MLHIFYTYVSIILSGYCVCFTMASSVFQVFLQVFQMHVSSVLSAFRCMLQVLYPNVWKVDWVLYLRPRLLLPRLDVSSSSSWRRLGIRTRGAGRCCPSPSSRCWWCSGWRGLLCEALEMECRSGRPDVQALVLPKQKLHAWCCRWWRPAHTTH